MKQTPEQLYQHLLYKYSHVGCPACGYEDNCDKPGQCAENGKCLDLSAPKPPMTRDQLLASDDQDDIDFLETIFQHETFNDPEDDPCQDEEEFWEPEDHDEGDLDCERDA
jgi:hypothetical protein